MEFCRFMVYLCIGQIPQNVTGKVSLRAFYEALDDKQLLERLRREDRDAFACIYRRYHAELYTFAMKYMKNRPDAEDVVQQVFIKLWMIREALVVTSNLRGYLFTMTKHQVMNYIRNSNNALQLNYKIVQQQPQYDDDLYMYAEKRHMTDLLRYAIETLPPRQRTVAVTQLNALPVAAYKTRSPICWQPISTQFS